MDDETKQRNERAMAELGEMFKRARPIREIWDLARGQISGQFGARKLSEIIFGLADCFEGNVSSRGISLSLEKRLPNSVRNVVMLHAIWIRGTVGLSPEVEQFKLEQKILLDEALLSCPPHLSPQIDAMTRLYALGREANTTQLESPIANSIDVQINTRTAAERGFLIVARRVVEQRLAEGERFEDVAESIINSSKGGFHWDIETMFTKTIKLRMQMLQEELAHTSNESANKEGLAVDAPAFEKRPVPKSDLPNGKNRKRIKG